MSLINPVSLATVPGAVPTWTGVTRPLDVLLVTDDPGWTAAVREAVAAEGGVVETVSARAAVARLASIGTLVSHVLVDQNGADGLLGTLAELTSDSASAEVTLLILVHAAGGPDSVRLDRKGPLPVTWNKPVGVRTSGEVY